MPLRYLHLAVFLICLTLISTALYMQYVLDMAPCPLCIFQRVAIMSIGFISLVALFHNPSHRLWHKIYGVFTGIIAIVGLALSGRHVWLQNLPDDQVPACGPGLEFMLETMPFQGVIEKVLKGSGECHDINWVFLGLTIPGWTFVLFVLFLLFALYQLRPRPQNDAKSMRF